VEIRSNFARTYNFSREPWYLYVYFLKDEDYLKDIVENLENQSKIKAVGLED